MLITEGAAARRARFPSDGAHPVGVTADHGHVPAALRRDSARCSVTYRSTPAKFDVHTTCTTRRARVKPACRSLAPTVAGPAGRRPSRIRCSFAVRARDRSHGGSGERACSPDPPTRWCRTTCGCSAPTTRGTSPPGGRVFVLVAAPVCDARSVGHDEHRPTRVGRAPLPVGLLGVEEEALVEGADLVDGLAAEQQHRADEEAGPRPQRAEPDRLEPGAPRRGERPLAPARRCRRRGSAPAKRRPRARCPSARIALL